MPADLPSTKRTVNDAKSVLYRLRNASDDAVLCEDRSRVLSTAPSAGGAFFGARTSAGLPIAPGTDMGFPHTLDGSVGPQVSSERANPFSGAWSKAPARPLSLEDTRQRDHLPEPVPGPAAYPLVSWQAGFRACGKQPLSSKRSAPVAAFPLSEALDGSIFAAAAARARPGYYAEACQVGSGSSALCTKRVVGGVMTKPNVGRPRRRRRPAGKKEDGVTGWQAEQREPSDSRSPGPAAYALPDPIGRLKWGGPGGAASSAMVATRERFAGDERRNVHMANRAADQRLASRGRANPGWQARIAGEEGAKRFLPSASATQFENDIERLQKMKIFTSQQLGLLRSVGGSGGRRTRGAL